MKIIIWLLCLFLFTLVQMLVSALNLAYLLASILSSNSDTTVLLSGLFSFIITIALLFLTYKVAKCLCGAWDRHREEKALKRSSTPTSPDVEESEQPSTPASPGVAEKPAVTKQRYCKLCGGAIDRESKKCTKCGKQYFRLTFKKPHPATIFVAIAVVILVCLNVMQFVWHRQQVAEYQQQIAEYQQNISNLTGEISSLTDDLDTANQSLHVAENNIKSLQQQVQTVRTRLHEINAENIDMKIFFNYHVAFASATGSREYHHFGCLRFPESYWVYSVREAEGLGFTPCPLCC